MSTADWLQTHCRRLFLRGLSVHAWIGVHDFEKEASQRLVLDVDLYVSLKGTSDSIADVVDYDFVRTVVHRRVKRGPIGLQETLCDDILSALLENPLVLAARVRTGKPDVYPDCELVGVEAFRMNTTARLPPP